MNNTEEATALELAACCIFYRVMVHGNFRGGDGPLVAPRAFSNSNCFYPVGLDFRKRLGHYSLAEFFITVLCLIYILSPLRCLPLFLHAQYSSFCLSFASHSAI